ncbi:hypothetical protein H5410_063999 [Solanum commersonii]|uniref:Uncharacterized protein n=1 Tax=Solanum commersonii TaxID=4109 RepID=A0A9J5W0E8_SOLCO|nr:hypothetical protein H5410_063999 [Solanum commersonii]
MSSPDRPGEAGSKRGGAPSDSRNNRRVGAGTPCPALRANPFRDYGSILPTSLAYIVPSTRGCSPWRPDAVMSTAGRGRHSVLRIFKGAGAHRTPRGVRCSSAAGPYLRLSRFEGGRLAFTWNLSLFGLQSSHLNICYYHQDLHRRPLRPGSRPRFCSDRRALLLIGAWHLPRRPGVGRALKRHPFSGLTSDLHVGIAAGLHQSFLWLRPASGIVHHLWVPTGMLTLEPFSKIKVGRRCTPGIPPISFLTPYGFTRPLTSHTCRTRLVRVSRRVEWGAHRPASGRADAEARRRRALPTTIEETAFRGRIESPGFGRPPNPRWSTPRVDRRTGSSPFHIRPGRIAGPHPLPSRQFQALFDSLFKVLFIFPSRLGRNSPPDLGCIPKQPDFVDSACVVRQGPGTTGLSPSLAPLPGTWARSALRTLLQDYNSDGGPPDSKAGLFPVRSPLLRESLLALQWILVKGFRLYSFQLQGLIEPGIVIYCHYLPVSGLAVSQAPSPESNPNSPSPVTTMGRNLNDASPARWPCDPSSYHESSQQRAEPASTFYLINASLPEVGVAFLSDARRAPHEPAARRTDGTKAKRGRRSQGAFVRFFRADKEPAKAPCPLRLPNPRIPAAARGPRPRTAKRGKAWDARAAFGPRLMLRKPRPMRAVHGRRRLTVVCSPRAMRPGHVRRRLTAVCSPRAMRPGHGRRVA